MEINHEFVLNEIEKPVLAQFKNLNIEYTLYRHEKIAGGDDTDNITLSTDAHRVKSIFLVDKNSKYYVISTVTTSKVDMALFSKQFKVSKTRFGSAEDMKKYLGVTPGSVTPLATINDPNKSVVFILDSYLKRDPSRILAHPLHNEASVLISLTDLIKYMEYTGHEVLWFDSDKKESNASIISKKKVDSVPHNVKTNLLSNIEHLGIAYKKNENFPEWYSQVITESGMIEYYNVSGCYVLRPSAYKIWECIQEYINSKISDLDVQNCYFPIFVTKDKLCAESTHIEGFTPEVAWVTRYGNSNLAEPIALRPTSETIMYSYFGKWIRSHRDLPLKLNQWCQVVRWEFKQPTPFIRSREFLWQEGHTAHATAKEAEEFSRTILDIYESIYTDLLAIPVIKGLKSESEKFAGAKFTGTVEAFIPTNGRAIQAATSHYLDTIFSKIFDISFEDTKGQKQSVYQTSWGLSTRAIGIVIMVHGDDKGLVLPPKIAPTQAVIIPICYKKTNDDVLSKCVEIQHQLKNKKIRVHLDNRDNYTPGWKYNDWELKGACIRIEIGPRNLQNQNVDIIRRDNNYRESIEWNKTAEAVENMLHSMQCDLYTKAKKKMNDSIVEISHWDQVKDVLNEKKLILAPWNETEESEAFIKKNTILMNSDIDANGPDSDSNNLVAMKPLCFPFDQKPVNNSTKCFISGTPASKWCLFGRSY